MKITLVLIFTFFLNHSDRMAGNVYISDCNNHSLSFVVFSDNQIIIEKYKSNLKLGIYNEKRRLIDENSIKRTSNTEIQIKKETYYLQEKCNLYGDFSILYAGFEGLSIKKKLNVCRNIAILNKTSSKETTLCRLIMLNSQIIHYNSEIFIKKHIIKSSEE